MPPLELKDKSSKNNSIVIWHNTKMYAPDKKMSVVISKHKTWWERKNIVLECIQL